MTLQHVLKMAAAPH